MKKADPALIDGKTLPSPVVGEWHRESHEASCGQAKSSSKADSLARSQETPSLDRRARSDGARTGNEPQETREARQPQARAVETPSPSVH